MYILKSKDQVLNKFEEWKAMVETQTGHKVKVLRSDNGGEYTSKAFDAFLFKHGIVRQTSAPYTSEQNGVAEHANRTIVEMARCMLYAQGLGREFWAEAVSNAVYTRNRCPNKALVNVTPEEAWSGKRPCISHMRVFGCIAYAKVPDEKRTKLDAKGTLGGSRYPSRVRKPLGEWWMNHILPPRDVEHANVVMHDEPHTMSEAMQSGDAKK